MFGAERKISPRVRLCSDFKEFSIFRILPLLIFFNIFFLTIIHWEKPDTVLRFNICLLNGRDQELQEPHRNE